MGSGTVSLSPLASHHSLDFLGLTETWISLTLHEKLRGVEVQVYCYLEIGLRLPSLSHLNTSSFVFHAVLVSSPINLLTVVIYNPPGPLGYFLGEINALLSLFPLTLFGEFNPQ